MASPRHGRMAEAARDVDATWPTTAQTEPLPPQGDRPPPRETRPPATGDRRARAPVDEPAASASIAASALSALALFAGVWLVVSRFVMDYPGAGGGTDAVGNGVVIGAVVAAVALMRMSTTASNPILGLVNVVLGGWMIASPWIFGYDRWTDGPNPAWSDVLTGALIVVFGLGSWAAGAARRSRLNKPAR